MRMTYVMILKIETVVMAVMRMDVVSHEYMCDCTYYVGIWQYCVICTIHGNTLFVHVYIMLPHKDVGLRLCQKL